LLFVTPGRDQSVFAGFAEYLCAQGADPVKLTDWSSDLPAAHQASARETMPDAAISFDPYHVVVLSHRALD